MLHLLSVAVAGPVDVSPPVVALAGPAEARVDVRNGSGAGVLVTPRVVELDTRECGFAPSLDPQPRSAVAWVRTAAAAWIAPSAAVPLPIRVADGAPTGAAALIVLDVATADTPRSAPTEPWGHVGVPVLLVGDEARVELALPRVDEPTDTRPLRVSAEARNPGPGWAHVALGALIWAPGGTLRTRVAQGAATWVAPGGACRVWSAESAWMEHGRFDVEAVTDGAAAGRVAVVVP